MDRETPKIIGEIQKNALQKIIVSIQEWKGKRFIDTRVYYQDTATGKWLPTKKGISLTLVNHRGVLNLIEKAAEVLREEEQKN